MVSPQTLARLAPYKLPSDDMLGVLCQLVVLANLLAAMLLKGVADELENEVLLESGDSPVSYTHLTLPTILLV